MPSQLGTTQESLTIDISADTKDEDRSAHGSAVYLACM